MPELRSISHGPRINALNTRVFTVPTDAPEADGTLRWDSTTMVLVEVSAGGKKGVGYTYASKAAADVVEEKLAAAIKGASAMDIESCYDAMWRAVRNLGRAGICSCAISAVDTALWDLKARLLDLPLVSLFGSLRANVPLYGSGGFTSYSIDRLQKQLGGWADKGFRMVKMKIGTHPDDDLKRVKAARKAIGDDAQLFVDANGAYARKQALYFAERFTEFDVRWFEEPVSSDDLEGLRLLRDRAPARIDIAAGEYGYEPIYFLRMLQAGAVDVLQADATRCGGFTGFLHVAALCEAFQVPLSAHTAPALHAHVCCAAPRLIHLEYFHDHVRIENMFFDGVLEPREGALWPDLRRPGMGLELKRADAQRYAA
jgi:L-alanine-DL-glutamate epimerase-like enolase superfamily enzyme